MLNHSPTRWTEAGQMRTRGHHQVPAALAFEFFHQLPQHLRARGAGVEHSLQIETPGLRHPLQPLHDPGGRVAAIGLREQR